MTTGSWTVRSSDCGYLTYANNGHGFGDAPDALVFSTKKAALLALEGYARAQGEEIFMERAYSHEEAANESAGKPTSK